MQLRIPGERRRPTLRTSLTLATATLLGSVATAEGTPPVETDVNVLYYGETDRVEVLEAELVVSSELREDERITVTFLFDSLTGPSPNGAAPAARAQTFTTASGRGTYTIAPGAEVLDPSFHDTRFAGSVGYGRKWGRLTDVQLGARVSTEHDYLSISGNAGLVREFNDRNTSLSLGLSYAADQWRPEGGVPIEGAQMGPVGPDQPRRASTDSKDVIDAVLGVTQVLGRTTLARINYTLSSSAGYLTDPYKFVSVVNGPGTVDAGEPDQYLFESRPDSRVRHSIYGQLRQYIRGSVLDASYRLHTDDWGVTSHTGDLRYRQPFAGTFFVQPHLRYYHQARADFFSRFLVKDQALPDHASADPRLAGFDSMTIGVKLGHVMPDGNELNITLEWYRQFGMRGPPDAFGTLSDLDLWSEAEAIMFRVSYGHDWSLF